MAIIDTERELVVVRIVYDGPPLSGKTTSIHALGKILGINSEVFSFDEELSGNTLYFDWMEYVGGFFKGYGISCQIVSVPGQLSLKEHRHFLLRTADVVVFVLDASDKQTEILLSYFQELQSIVLQNEEEVVRVIIQANKQDQSEALSPTQIRALFDDNTEIKMVESIALSGKGIRETFVLAVRLAVERTETLINKGLLKQGKPKINNGKELLSELQQFISAPSDSNLLIKAISVEPTDSFLEPDQDIRLPLESEDVDSIPSEKSAKTETEESVENTPSFEDLALSPEENTLALDSENFEPHSSQRKNHQTEMEESIESSLPLEVNTLPLNSDPLDSLPSRTESHETETEESIKNSLSFEDLAVDEETPLPPLTEPEASPNFFEEPIEGIRSFAELTANNELESKNHSSATISEEKQQSTTDHSTELESQKPISFEDLETSEEAPPLINEWSVPESTIPKSEQLSELDDSTFDNGPFSILAEEWSDKSSVSEETATVEMVEEATVLDQPLVDDEPTHLNQSIDLEAVVIDDDKSTTLAESSTQQIDEVLSHQDPTESQTADSKTEETAISSPSPIKKVHKPASKSKKTSRKHLPKFPDEDTPTQWIWPPFSGRHILNDVLKYPLRPQLQADGTWIINAKDEWRCFSHVQWLYDHLDLARDALRANMRMHLQCSPILSEQRCVAIAYDVKNTWRLWQIVHSEPSLAEYLTNTLKGEPPDKLVPDTLKWANNYLEILQQCELYPPLLNLSLENISLTASSKMIYLGLIDENLSNPIQPVKEQLIETVKMEFAKWIAEVSSYLDFTTIIEAFDRIEGFEESALLEVLKNLFSEWHKAK